MGFLQSTVLQIQLLAICNVLSDDDDLLTIGFVRIYNLVSLLLLTKNVLLLNKKRQPLGSSVVVMRFLNVSTSYGIYLLGSDITLLYVTLRSFLR